MRFVVPGKEPEPQVVISTHQEHDGVIIMAEGWNILKFCNDGTVVRYSGVGNDVGLRLDSKRRVRLEDYFE